MQPWQFLVFGIVSAIYVAATPPQSRDAVHLPVKAKLLKDMSGVASDPPEKYFHESTFHPHYDGRFAEHELNYQQQKLALKNLVQTFLSTFKDIGVETWLMHGSLLGWWWGKHILPWDSDVDVQVSEASIFFLAAYYNMSVFHYKSPRIPDGRDYMLEINPHFKNRERNDPLNVIDARWIDTESGLFIDITGVRYDMNHPKGEGMLYCKDGHEYHDVYLFPLRTTTFEGVEAKIPYRYRQLLREEYGQWALENTEYSGHHFDDDKMEWVPKMAGLNLQSN
ncbi:LicD family-domain-containing protein [Podospora didyma]|uniref:LicD family-domain-containing protein n=1 Tax=Podospora didyma TaxID=330526 RepID=A0AAE0P608_9PEZI|nr:LicD family-domain-containing protein [Podospora didyma]